MPKFFKRVIIVATICIVLCLSFIYSLNLTKESDRAWGDHSLTVDLKALVEKRITDLEKMEDIIEACCDVATDYLSFVKANDIANRKANCVGYARLTSAFLNHAFRKKNMTYKAKPVVGTVHSFGVNLNNVAQSTLPSSW